MDEEKERMDLFGEKAHEKPGAAPGESLDPNGKLEPGEKGAEHPGEKGTEKSMETGAEKPTEKGAEKPTETAPSKEANQPAFPRGEETVGEILLAARERLGQTLEFMSQETKIPKQMLQYLETDNYDALPAKVYVKGFLRTYAMALDLDVQYILNKYEVQTGQTHRSKGDHWEIESEIVEEKIRSPIVLKRFILPVIIGIVIVILIMKLAGRKEEKAAPPPRQDLREELLQKKPEPKFEETQREIEPAEAQSAVEPMELRVSSNPTDSCWFELVAVSIIEQQPETTTIRFILPPGSSRSFQATEEFMFKKVGNAGGFVMELNGNKLPTLGKKGKVITNYRITRDNLPKSKKND